MREKNIFLTIAFLLLAFLTTYCSAQLPAQYVGKWQIQLQYQQFADYKNTFISGMKANAEYWKTPLKQYYDDSTAFINKLHANYDSTAKHTLTLTADSLYEFRFYDNVYKVWRINAELYQYDNTKGEITLTNSCSTTSQKFKIVTSPAENAVITFEEVFTTTYNIGYDCFPGTCTLRKVE